MLCYLIAKLPAVRILHVPPFDFAPHLCHYSISRASEHTVGSRSYLFYTYHRYISIPPHQFPWYPCICTYICVCLQIRIISGSIFLHIMYDIWPCLNFLLHGSLLASIDLSANGNLFHLFYGWAVAYCYSLFDVPPYGVFLQTRYTSWRKGFWDLSVSEGS